MNHKPQINQDTSSIAPKLAPPGAGIPWIQRVMVKFFVLPRLAIKMPNDVIRKAYEKTTQRMIEGAQSLTEDQRQQKVLISPLPGLEDSSRYWSVDDVFEHLLIVAPAMSELVVQLASGVPSERVIDIASVKPGKAVGPHFESFKRSMPNLFSDLDKKLIGKSLTNTITKDHPWFGPMNAKQWYWLLLGHQRIHAKQVQKIIEGLRS